MSGSRLAALLERTADVCRTVDVPAAERAEVLVAVNRLQLDLGALAERLQPNAGVNGTPVPLPPTKPAPPPPPPPPEK